MTIDWSDRFWSKVTPEALSGCWLWTAGLNNLGYGQAHVDGRTVSAHRHSYTLVHGAIPDGMIICHRCDVPACVNPDHLFAGTHLDNTTDMIRKGRHAKGTLMGRPSDLGTPRDTSFILRAHCEQLDRWRKAAERDGLTLSGWIRKLADKASVKTKSKRRA